ncbi:MAG TPA: hypothetical protein VGQ81_01590 [Acidobacteriota bacterium]|jgi:hypothetical protein|nr:hypothetical protein [Acidobacteriota bacterium]
MPLTRESWLEGDVFWAGTTNGISRIPLRSRKNSKKLHWLSNDFNSDGYLGNRMVTGIAVGTHTNEPMAACMPADPGRPCWQIRTQTFTY